MVISRKDGGPKKSIMTKIAIIGTAFTFPWISTPKPVWEKFWLAEKDWRVMQHRKIRGRFLHRFSILTKELKTDAISIRGGHMSWLWVPTQKGFEFVSDYLSKQDKFVSSWSLLCSKGSTSSMGLLPEKEKAEKLWLWYSGIYPFRTSSSHQLFSDIYCRSLESTISRIIKSSGI